MQTEITMIKGHYQMSLPYKEGQCGLPCNQSLALERLSQLKRRLKKRHEFKERYTIFLSKLLSKGYTEKAELAVDSQFVVYIHHYGVYNVNKPGTRFIRLWCR